MELDEYPCSIVQSKKSVTVYFSSKQLLPFGFAEQYCAMYSRQPQSIARNRCVIFWEMWTHHLLTRIDIYFAWHWSENDVICYNLDLCTTLICLMYQYALSKQSWNLCFISRVADHRNLVIKEVWCFLAHIAPVGCRECKTAGCNFCIIEHFFYYHISAAITENPLFFNNFANINWIHIK